ncbi:MAG TPA: YdjY domain-containing protein [Candidatus Saccharimonadia bacterium]|nr:YdjY domain-containing protein [Candidatus Saccharimonadia bacterium]
MTTIRTTLHAVSAACFLQAAALPLCAQEEPPKQPTVSTTPAGAKVAADLAEAAKNRIKKVGPSEYELGPIKINSATREVRVPAQVNMTEGILEYALVHEHGKTHESLLRTTASPTELNVALLLSHFEPHLKEAAKFLAEPSEQVKTRMAQPMEHEGANRMRLTLEWKDASGKAQSAPISAWIRDKHTGKPATAAEWIYTGSFISQTGFAAEHDGSHIAIYFDLISLVNFPDKNNSSDENWLVESAAMPPVDTPVTLVFAPVTPPSSSAVPSKAQQ